MTNIEQKALELVNEVREERRLPKQYNDNIIGSISFPALCRAIERHEAFRQEVSDAVSMCRTSIGLNTELDRFIIAKPDPLEKLLQSIAITLDANDLREALDEAGLEIREKGK